jgi:hypothetical protein
MFKQLSTAAAALSVSLFSGCAIKPLPEDVTGVTTAGIVKQIRCETRDAGRAIVMRELDRLATAGNERAQNLLSQYRENPDLMTTFNWKASFPGDGYRYVRDFFDVVYSAGLAYNFDLTMSEENNLTAGANLLGPWQATWMIGIGGDANRKRQNKRSFTTTDTLGYLLTTLNTPVRGVQYCDGHVALGPNYIYPIVGRVGIYETVYTFFQLSLFDNLQLKTKDGTPALGDTLTFTTMVDLMVSPKVVFAPAKFGGNQITDTSLTGKAIRTDIHQVTVGLALDPASVSLKDIRGFVFSPERTARGGARVAVGPRSTRPDVLVLTSVVASAGTNAEELAVHVVDQIKSREVQLLPPQ